MCALIFLLCDVFYKLAWNPLKKRFSFSDIMPETDQCFVFREMQIHISLYLAYNFYWGRYLIIHERIFIYLLKKLQFKIRYFLCVNTRFSKEDKKLNYIIYSFMMQRQWTQNKNVPSGFSIHLSHLGVLKVYQFPVYYFLLFIALYILLLGFFSYLFEPTKVICVSMWQCFCHSWLCKESRGVVAEGKKSFVLAQSIFTRLKPNRRYNQFGI